MLVFIFIWFWFWYLTIMTVLTIMTLPVRTILVTGLGCSGRRLWALYSRDQSHQTRGMGLTD